MGEKLRAITERSQALPGRGKSKRDTNHIGEISEAAITTRFLQLGYTVLTPFGGNQRYDLVIEDADGQFWRVQCKSATTSKDETVLIFQASIQNVTGKHRQLRNYSGQCDYFASYCEKLNKIFLVPVEHIHTNTARLRLVPIKRMRKDMLWARDYEL